MRVVVREGLIQLLVYFHADAAWIAFVIHFLWCFFWVGGLGMEGGQIQPRRDFSQAGGQPQARTFTYQSSTVTYGGINGAYYTTSKTRRSGSDGVRKFS
jgi:hypothetical protein